MAITPSVPIIRLSHPFATEPERWHRLRASTKSYAGLHESVDPFGEPQQRRADPAVQRKLMASIKHCEQVTLARRLVHMLFTPFRSGTTHVVKLRPVRIEQLAPKWSGYILPAHWRAGDS
jgi:hypothetical protein